MKLLTLTALKKTGLAYPSLIRAAVDYLDLFALNVLPTAIFHILRSRLRTLLTGRSNQKGVSRPTDGIKKGQVLPILL